MSGRLRLAWRLALVLAHVVVAFAIVGLIFPFCSPANRQRLIRWWSGRVLAICRMRLEVIGPRDAAAGGASIADALEIDGIGAMLVMNHVSWLDIFVIHSLRPARFVAKAEIARWPLLGYLVDRTGAVFIERGKRHAVREANQRVAAMLAAGNLIGMFPEGAVSDGLRLLPFHANLLQPAIDVGAPIVVAALRYRDAHGDVARATDYTGGVTMLRSIVRIVSGGPLVAQLHLIAALDGRSETRHAASRTARAAIADALGFHDAAEEAADRVAGVVGTGDAPVSRGGGPGGREPGTAHDPRVERP